MEILNKEESADLLFNTKGKEGAMSKWIKMLAVGETLKISPADWTGKRPPFYIATYISKKSGRKFLCGSLPGFDGWVIKRME